MDGRTIDFVGNDRKNASSIKHAQVMRLEQYMFLMQRLSVAMQRGNAACILGTIADDDFSTECFV